jgi:hypothetical protein
MLDILPEDDDMTIGDPKKPEQTEPDVEPSPQFVLLELLNNLQYSYRNFRTALNELQKIGVRVNFNTLDNGQMDMNMDMDITIPRGECVAHNWQIEPCENGVGECCCDPFRVLRGTVGRQCPRIEG